MVVIFIGIGTAIIITIGAGLLSIMSFYFTFSKKAEGFYEGIDESIDATGYFIIVGLIIKGLHKLYKQIFKNNHTLALRITLFFFGVIFLLMGIGIWFLV